MTVAERRALPYMQPGRADVIGAGALILDRVAAAHPGRPSCASRSATSSTASPGRVPDAPARTCGSTLLPHPVTGELFASPGPARHRLAGATPPPPGTPVAHTADDVAALRRLRATSATLDAAVISVCRACERLVRWREDVALAKRASFAGQPYWGRPIAGWGDDEPRVLVVGLAPAANGGNRTGRIFTGDRSGDWLFASLHRVGLATRRDLGTTPATGSSWSAPGWSPRCAARRRTTSRPSRSATPARPGCVREVELVVAVGARGRLPRLVRLGRRAARLPRRGVRRPAAAATLRARRRGDARAPPTGASCTVLGCYHPSQQNTFTGKLTEPMLDAVLGRAARSGRAALTSATRRWKDAPVTLQAITVIGHDRPGIIAETTPRPRRPRAEPRGLHDDPAAGSLRDDADLRRRRPGPPRSRRRSPFLTADGSLDVSVREVPEEPERRAGRRRRTCSPCTARTGPASSAPVAARWPGSAATSPTSPPGWRAGSTSSVAEVDLPAGADVGALEESLPASAAERSASG